MDGETVSLPNQDQKPSDQPSPEIPVAPRKKINLLGIIFIVITLILFPLGILNYFNILPLSSLFPHQQPKQSNDVKIPPTTAPTSSLAKQAKETLIAFLPTILKPPLLPQSSSDINLREDKGIKQFVSGTWDTKDGRAITIFTVSPDGKEISQLLIFFPYAVTSSISAEFAQSTIPKLFSITPKGKWACKTIPNTANYCENFWEDQTGARKGIALKESTLSQAKKITVYYCRHNKDSRLYSWKSCTPEFAESGVK